MHLPVRQLRFYKDIFRNPPGVYIPEGHTRTDVRANTHNQMENPCTRFKIFYVILTVFKKAV